MKKYKNIIFLLVLLPFIHTVCAQMKALSDRDMGKVTGQSGIVGNLIAFGEAFASTGGSKEDLDRAVSFNLAYITQFKDLDKNVRNFQEIFQRIETKSLEDGWTAFDFEYDSKEELKIPGVQLAYTDVYSEPVETGLGLFGLGGFKVEKSGTNHIQMTGKVKIEFRP